MALISLANILHRARHSNEAAIVVQAALDVSKDLNVNHFTLGNIYAVSDSVIGIFLKLCPFTDKDNGFLSRINIEKFHFSQKKDSKKCFVFICVMKTCNI